MTPWGNGTTISEHPGCVAKPSQAVARLWDDLSPPRLNSEAAWTCLARGMAEAKELTSPLPTHLPNVSLCLGLTTSVSLNAWL